MIWVWLPRSNGKPREFQKRTNIRCEASLEEKQIIATPDQATALFRVLQEILTNVARHSQASKVRVSLKAEGRNLLMEVKDNGRGIEPQQVSGAARSAFWECRNALPSSEAR